MTEAVQKNLWGQKRIVKKKHTFCQKILRERGGGGNKNTIFSKGFREKDHDYHQRIVGEKNDFLQIIIKRQFTSNNCRKNAISVKRLHKRRYFCQRIAQKNKDAISIKGSQKDTIISVKELQKDAISFKGSQKRRYFCQRIA